MEKELTVTVGYKRKPNAYGFTTIEVKVRASSLEQALTQAAFRHYAVTGKLPEYFEVYSFHGLPTRAIGKRKVAVGVIGDIKKRVNQYLSRGY